LALDSLAIGRLERRGRQVHLASDIDAAGDLLAQRERDRLDRAEIPGDVLADRSIAASRALRELSVDVGEIDREAVDLELADVPDVVTAERLTDALIECADLGLVERVGQAEHRVRVLDRRESVRRWRADPLGRRLRRDELRVLRLEGLELAHERVVREVVERRLIEDVVLVIRLLDPLAELGDALLGFRNGHTW